MNIFYTDTFTDTATDLIANHIKSSLVTNQHFVLGLSGGNTPKPIYEELAKIDDIDWSKVFIIFSDERTVAVDHEDSNYKMADEHLLSRIKIDQANILRMKGELEANQAAKDYEEQLSTLQKRLSLNELRPDLLLLGLGADGHTASLFPDTLALDENKRLCVANEVPQLETTRITLTYSIINSSKEILFLVSGKNKQPVVKKVISGDNSPAAKVNSINGSTTWLLDWLPN